MAWGIGVWDERMQFCVEKVNFWFLESRLTRNVSKMKPFKCFTLRTRTLRPFFHGLRDRRMRRAHAILCMHSHWMLVVQLCNFAAQLSYSTLTEGRKLSNYYKAFGPLGWTKSFVKYVDRKARFSTAKSFLVWSKIILTRTKYFGPSPNLFMIYYKSSYILRSPQNFSEYMNFTTTRHCFEVETLKFEILQLHVGPVQFFFKPKKGPVINIYRSGPKSGAIPPGIAPPSGVPDLMFLVFVFSCGFERL